MQQQRLKWQIVAYRFIFSQRISESKGTKVANGRIEKGQKKWNERDKKSFQFETVAKKCHD